MRPRAAVTAALPRLLPGSRGPLRPYPGDTVARIPTLPLAKSKAPATPRGGPAGPARRLHGKAALGRRAAWSPRRVPGLQPLTRASRRAGAGLGFGESWGLRRDTWALAETLGRLSSHLPLGLSFPPVAFYPFLANSCSSFPVRSTSCLLSPTPSLPTTRPS